MKLKKIVTTSAVAAVIAFGATPAHAQRNDRNGNDRGQSDSGQARQERAAPRDNPSAGRAVPRQNVRPPQAPSPRQEFRATPRDDQRGVDRRTFDRRGPDAGRFRGPSVRIAPRFQRVAPRAFYTPRVYRPGFSLGFGIFFGQPFPYRHAYPVSPYAYSTVVPGVAYGAISFGISPGTADVYVDGNYVGGAEEFDGGAEPLTLSAGSHRIELQAAGYRPMVFDVNIRPGQVIPYHGAMQPGY